MPTFDSYVNDLGYYITVHPSDVGNVTYKIDAEVTDFVLKLGYKHKSQSVWGVVKPLCVSALTYANQHRITEDDGDIPGLDSSKLPSMSKQERDK